MARLPYVIPYDPAFLEDGFVVPMPTLRCRGRVYRGGESIDYIHFSVVMHRDRRSAVLTAHNIDVSQRRSVPRTTWDLDGRVDGSVQTGPEAYVNNPWDRGHLVRRAAVAWGETTQRARDASDSTFFYTNGALQHQRFNQDEWVDLEDWVLDSAGQASARLCVFTGPLYTVHDVYVRGFRVPSAFFKVVVLRDPSADDGDDLSAVGFIMKQNELWDDWNGAATHDLETYQVGLREIGLYAGIEFGELAALDEFEWRHARFRDRDRMAPVRIRGPQDLAWNGGRRRSRGVRALRLAAEDEDPGRAVGPHGQGCACDPAATVSLEDRVERLAEQVAVLSRTANALLDEELDGEELEEIRAGARLQLHRVVGGSIVGVGEYRDCAVIGSDDSWFCSGVLVQPRVVLTAAHCASSIERVYLDSRSVSQEGVVGEVVDVAQVIVHPDYDPWLVPSHDIAVLLLDDPATIAPVGIATSQQVATDPDVTVVGFGYNHPSEPIGFGTKRKVNVTKPLTSGLSPDEIEDLEQEHGFDNGFELYAGRKGLGKDSCNGDSGGPAYVEVGGTTLVAALTSRAADSAELNCGDGGIYTRVAPYLAWLHEATSGLVGEASADAEPPAAAAGWVYVSAVLPNPEGPDTGNEWIEITNVGAATVPLAGWALADRQGGELALDGEIGSRARRRIRLEAGAELRLANTGDNVALRRGDTAVHRVSYGESEAGQVHCFANPYADAPGTACDAQPPGTPSDADPC